MCSLFFQSGVGSFWWETSKIYWKKLKFSNESFICPENKTYFDKEDSDAKVYLNKTFKLKSQLLINYRVIKNENKIRKSFSFNSGLTYGYASLSEDSEFFLTKSTDLKSSFQDETESYSSEKKTCCNESQSLVENNANKTKLNLLKFR